MARQKFLLGRSTFKIDVYSSEVTVTIVTTTTEASNMARYILRKLKMESDSVEKKVYGYTIQKGRVGHIIFAAEELNINTVTHETYHMTEYIEQFHGLVQDDNKEASANINGFLNEKVFQALDELDIKYNG